MSNDIYFRTALSGYNKNDVISFIEKLNSEQVERVNELNERLRSAQTESKRLSTEVAELKAKCAELEAQLSMSDETRALNAEKAQKYETMQGSYADIMLEAEHTSKEKVRIAEERAEKILAEANETKRQIVAENKKIIETSKTEFMTLIDKLTASLDDTLSRIGTDSNE